MEEGREWVRTREGGREWVRPREGGKRKGGSG